MTIARGSRRILMHGLVFVLVGLIWGFCIPATPYPRLALVAHIQLTGNGLLFIVLGLLLVTLPHRVGARSILVMLLAVWLTWAMVLSEVANAWWGTNQMLPIAAAQAGALGGKPWQERILQLTHASAGVGLLTAWILLIIGFMKSDRAANSDH